MQFLYMPSFKKTMIFNQMGSKIRAIYSKSFPWNRPFRVGLDYLLTWPDGRGHWGTQTDANPSHTVTCGFPGASQPWMLKPAWFMQLVCFTNPKASEFSRFLVDYIWGDCGFHVLVLGEVFFFLNRCVGDVPLESWHSVDGRNHTPSHSPLKKRWNLKITNWKWHFWGSSY